jgi:hypothetical protein
VIYYSKGAPHHAEKAIAAGMDLVIAQGGEGGGHTGEIGTMVLLRQVLKACEGKTSTFTGGPIMVCGAGGIADGQGLAACLSLGAQAVCVLLWNSIFPTFLFTLWTVFPYFWCHFVWLYSRNHCSGNRTQLYTM